MKIKFNLRNISIFIFILLMIIGVVILKEKSDNKKSVYYFRKIKNNKIFISKKINIDTVKQFYKIYYLKVNNFYNNNSLVKNFDIRNENIYFFILRNSFKELETYDPILLKNTKELKNINNDYLGIFENLKYFDKGAETDDEYIDGLFKPEYNVIFIENFYLNEIINILIAEVNHYIINKNFKENTIQNSFNNYFDNSYLHLVNDAITNLYSYILDNNLGFDFNDELLKITMIDKKNHLKEQKIKNINDILYHIKYYIYDYKEPEKNLFNYEDILLIYLYDKFGYDGILKLIKSLYNNPYRGIDNLFMLLYKDNFENIILKAKNYFINIINK